MSTKTINVNTEPTATISITVEDGKVSIAITNPDTQPLEVLTPKGVSTPDKEVATNPQAMSPIDSLKLYKLVTIMPSAIIYATNCGSVWTQLTVDHVKDLEIGTVICVSAVHEDPLESVAINLERTQEGWIITAIN